MNQKAAKLIASMGINSGTQLLELAIAGMAAGQGIPVQEPRDPAKVIDRKFIILAINPANGKVYTEEDALLLCAKDAAVPTALMAYHDRCVELEAEDTHTDSILKLYDRVRGFQTERGGGRVPDTVGAELPRCLKGEGL